LELNVDNGQQEKFAVPDNMPIAGDTPRVKFQGSYKPALGETINIIIVCSFNGKFVAISVDVFSATLFRKLLKPPGQSIIWLPAWDTSVIIFSICRS